MGKKKNNTEIRHSVKSENFFQKNFLTVSIILILTAVLSVYSNSFQNSFQYDDVHYIFQSNVIKNFDSFKNLGFWFDFNGRAPAQFTLALNYYFGEYGITGYHVVNVAIHFTSAILVFILLGIILNSKAIKQDYIVQNRKIIQLFTSLIFAVHPIQTESVTYIVQRMESLSGVFYIAALIFYYLFREESSGLRKKIIEFSLFFLAALLAVMTKQTAYSLPLTILLMEIYFIRDRDGLSNKKLIITISAVLVFAVLIGLFADILPREYL